MLTISYFNFYLNLRFSGFNEEWEEVKLNELLTFKNGLNASKEKYGSGIKFINVSDILDNEFITYENINDNVQVTDNEFENYKIEYGDIVFQRSSETMEEVGTANVYLSKQPCIYGGFVIRGKKNGNYDPYFLKQLLQSTRVRKEIISWSGGSTRYNIGQDSLNKISLILPLIEEQQVISKFFCYINKRIQLLQNKYNSYQNFKKYLMQQIFTQKLRFKTKNNENFEEWKERKLSEILLEHKLKSTGNEEVYSVSVHKGLVNQVEHLGRIFSAPDTSKYNLVKPGDIVYTKSPTGDFPLGIIKQSRVEKNVIVSPLYGVFTPETYDLGYILNDYFESNVNTYNYLHPIVQKGAKNTMNITNKTFLSRSLFVPTDKTEQHRIAQCLMKFNKYVKLIERHKNQIEKFKQGLLQQMFV